MDSSEFLRFLTATIALCAVALVITTAVTPPDPFSLIGVAVPLVVFSPVVSYVLVYRVGLGRLESGA
ncbi:hypothetical protein [Natrialba sp. INN-245]|uniref:DUF7534 family protein n=1 Tax=Natrialba sp. INN-245 TaxID=2690967 RepID=UPI0013136984|nr:hypothetical protein [Natrialba sp. INN-245]MWV41669.1 hypothetical protein [Natrialba sp. INN-245]